uniref:Uncharacterized protein n=1 Tax=Setaria viridis TaxID=4556 RepID=A0A4U6ULY4_SETVI|nr:hypothetical protein SEVIR_5G281850v2 [Setaria viridis]
MHSYVCLTGNGSILHQSTSQQQKITLRFYFLVFFRRMMGDASDSAALDDRSNHVSRKEKREMHLYTWPCKTSVMERTIRFRQKTFFFSGRAKQSREGANRNSSISYLAWQILWLWLQQNCGSKKIRGKCQ